MPDTSQRRVAMSCGSRQADLCGTLGWKKWFDKFCLAVSASLAVEGKYTDIWHNTGLEKHPLFCGGFISCFQEVSSTLLWANRLISYFDMLMLALLWDFHKPVTHHLAMAQTDWLRISSWTADFFTLFFSGIPSSRASSHRICGKICAAIRARSSTPGAQSWHWDFT